MDNKLAIIMASMLPFDTLVKRLQEAIDKYRDDNSQENKESLSAMASMVLMNHIAGGSLDGAIKISERFEQMDSLEQLFNIEKN